MLPYIAAGFGFGVLLYPWFSPAQGLLTMPQEMARQCVVLLVTLFVAANVKESPTLKRVPPWIPAVIALVAALILRQTVLQGLPFVPGDEDEYLFQARIFARGHVTAPAPPEAAQFWAPGLLIHGGRWFGHHQPGHSLLLALGVLIGAPGLIPAVSTGLTVLLIALTARRLGGDEAGTLSGMLAMFSPMLLLTGATLASETTSLLLVSAVIWMLVAEPLGAQRSPLWGGVLLGALLNVRGVTGIATMAAACVLLGRRSRLLVPGVVAGILAMMAHNALTVGSPLVLPFQVYEPQALGFKGSFGPLRAVAHVLRNALLLNLWLLGWPVSFILLRRGFGVDPRLTRAAGAFITVIVAGTAFYWHPGQVATGPLRLHETILFLLLFSGLGWHRAVQSRAFLSRYVPLAIAAAHLGFLPVREAVLATFIRTALEPRIAMSQLNLDGRAVVLSGQGNLFHYPVNDPWLHDEGPVFMREDPAGDGAPWGNRSRLRLVARCDTTQCTWSLTAAPPGANERPPGDGGVVSVR